MSNVRFIGLDVHAETIAVAVAEPDGEVRSLGEIPNRAESLRKLVNRLGPPERLRVCYEAGPTGYVVYWQLTALGVTLSSAAANESIQFSAENRVWDIGGILLTRASAPATRAPAVTPASCQRRAIASPLRGSRNARGISPTRDWADRDRIRKSAFPRP